MSRISSTFMILRILVILRYAFFCFFFQSWFVCDAVSSYVKLNETMIDLHVFFPFKFLLQWGCQLNMFYDLGHVFLVLWNFFYNLSSVHLFPPFFNSWHRSLEILVVAMIPFCWILLSFWQLESPHANWIYGVNRFMRSLKIFFSSFLSTL